MSGNPVVLKWNDFLPTTIDVGWRVQYENGFVDMMWGNTKDDESLKLLLEDIERHYGKKEVIDCRGSEHKVHNNESTGEQD